MLGITAGQPPPHPACSTPTSSSSSFLPLPFLKRKRRSFLPSSCSRLYRSHSGTSSAAAASPFPCTSCARQKGQEGDVATVSSRRLSHRDAVRQACRGALAQEPGLPSDRLPPHLDHLLDVKDVVLVGGLDKREGTVAGGLDALPALSLQAHQARGRDSQMGPGINSKASTARARVCVCVVVVRWGGVGRGGLQPFTLAR